jgi:hypothetical protein
VERIVRNPERRVRGEAEREDLRAKEPADAVVRDGREGIREIPEDYFAVGRLGVPMAMRREDGKFT